MSTRRDTERPIAVVLVDDHAVVRRGLRGFLELVDDIEVVGEAANGRSALERLALMAATAELPDVVLMDLVMPAMDGITATRLIRERHPAVAVVAMTSFSEADRVQSALSAGASGYLLKDAEAAAVTRAIREAHRGGLPLDPTAARELARALASPTGQSGQGLTEREQEVLSLLAGGLSNRQIAERLVLSERTARTHVSNILTKLGLHSRTQAALWAIEHGVVPAPSRPPR